MHSWKVDDSDAKSVSESLGGILGLGLEPKVNDKYRAWLTATLNSLFVCVSPWFPIVAKDERKTIMEIPFRLSDWMGSYP